VNPYYHAFWASTSQEFDPQRHGSSALAHAQSHASSAELGGMPNLRVGDWHCTRHWDQEGLFPDVTSVP
jgi:hypothetical protein